MYHQFTSTNGMPIHVQKYLYVNQDINKIPKALHRIKSITYNQKPNGM